MGGNSYLIIGCFYCLISSIKYRPYLVNNCPASGDSWLIKCIQPITLPISFDSPGYLGKPNSIAGHELLLYKSPVAAISEFQSFYCGSNLVTSCLSSQSPWGTMRPWKNRIFCQSYPVSLKGTMTQTSGSRVSISVNCSSPPRPVYGRRTWWLSLGGKQQWTLVLKWNIPLSTFNWLSIKTLS